MKENSFCYSLDSTLWSLLKREKAKNTMAHLGMGSTYNQLFVDERGYLNTEHCGQPINMVNTRLDGTYVQERTMTYVTKVVKKELEYPKFDFHSLRHPHATEFSEVGVNIKR